MERVLCVAPHCGKQLVQGKQGRGLCDTCYQEARRMIRLDKTTWAELESLGLAVPPKRRLGSKKSKFELAVDQARANRNCTDVQYNCDDVTPTITGPFISHRKPLTGPVEF